MAHSIFRTSSVAIKKPIHKLNSGSVKDSKSAHKVNGLQQNRRNTMHPRARDSVLSTGSSDRSSMSDESLLSPPCPEGANSLLQITDCEHIMSFDVDAKMGEVWPVKCRFVVREILQTEIAYVRSLSDIVKGYLKPLYSHLLSSGDNPNFIKTVFSNVVKIYHNHIELMECFQETCKSPCEFASCFLRFDFLSLYTVYCTGYSRGNECLEKSLAENSELKDFIEQCQRDIGHSLPLSSQLIKPVQRILKYRLLLEELLKNFDSDHSHRTAIMAALDKMAAVAEQINTSFTKPKGEAKALPSAVAKRRTHQIRDLQKSRSSKGRKSSTLSPTHTKLQHRCTSEYQLNASDSNKSSHSHYGMLSNDRVLGSSVQSVNHNGGLWTLPSGYVSGIGEKTVSQELETRTNMALPSVSQLRNYFENLNKEDSSRETSSSGAMKRAASLADTRMDPATGRMLSSPPSSSSSSPTKLSPQPRKRRSSLSSADSKCRFRGDDSWRRRETSPSSPFTDGSERQRGSMEDVGRRGSVEEDIRKQVKANRVQRTLV